MARAPKKKVVLIPNGERFTLNLIGALFATVGVVILFVLGKAIHGYLRTADLVSVEARILKVEYVPGRGYGSNSNTIAEYSYSYDGASYRSSNVSLFRSSGFAYGELKSAHETGRTHPVWIDPDSPSYAVINREWHGLKVLFVLPFIFVFGGLGGYLISLGCRGTR
jgi:hypothetical protein